MRRRFGLAAGLVAAICGSASILGCAATPGVDSSDKRVFVEVDGLVAVEAEHYATQTHNESRRWVLTSADHDPGIEPDGDPPHVEGTSSGGYLEALPDTRRTHGDPLERGVNFFNNPAETTQGVLTYRVRFNTPGRYRVWARLYSTGTEDNGLHVGLEGAWPESGRRLQWCEGKHTWRWESRQRTAEQ
ncbi:MAG: hypothetical protein AAF078_12685, partial [Planctomycetota bacterium]